MFNTVLDVVLGMIFIYLLLSLMCSAANEMIELLLKKRAVDLERGIREMLAPGSKSGADDIVRKLYNHPLINNLFFKSYQDSGIGTKLRYVWRTHLPSYIPKRSFALALMDLFTVPLDTGASPPASPAPSGATGATPSANITATAPKPPGDPENPLTPLRKGIASSPLFEKAPEVRQGLIALVDAAGSDVAKARENFETWFNDSMDSVSGWYKRRTQVVILILGLLIAVLVNADSIAIAKRLSTDRALRDSLVAASLEYARAHAAPTPTPSASGSETPPMPKAPACSDEKDESEECKRQKQKLEEACKKPDSGQCKYVHNQLRLESLGLPVGWKSTGEKFSFPFLLKLLKDHALGWLLTALAISLGAPFWFDLLNKFVVVRSAVKPQEKSPESESKG